MGLPQGRARTAVGVLALGFTASTPASADFSVVRFELGFCRIRWNNGVNPIGTGWTRVATAPDFGKSPAKTKSSSKSSDKNWRLANSSFALYAARSPRKRRARDIVLFEASI
jgi:hypothetical protein